MGLCQVIFAAVLGRSLSFLSERGWRVIGWVLGAEWTLPYLLNCFYSHTFSRESDISIQVFFV
jgi:hypothetical protein